MEFEWNPAKTVENLHRLRVSFHEPASVFGDSLGVTVPGPGHSAGERRFIAVELSNRGMGEKRAYEEMQ